MNSNSYCSPRAVAALLEARGIRPSKALGQNFLVDSNVLSRIADAAQLPVGAAGAADAPHVLEVGPGLGALTYEMLTRGWRVTACEKDPQLQPLLRERFAPEMEAGQFDLLCGDALELNYGALFGTTDGAGVQHLVANLPYSVGTRIVVEAATCGAPPKTMTLLLQKEVCQRFAAAPRTADRGAVSVWLQRLYDVKLVRDVPPGCFVPRPEVTSTVVALRRHDRHPLTREAEQKFLALVKAAFLHRRKQLAAAMKGAGALAKKPDEVREVLRSIGLAETARPEELTVEDWLRLAAAW